MARKTGLQSQVASYQRLDASLFNTQKYKVGIKGKVEQSTERRSALPYTMVKQLSKWEPSGHTRLRSPTLLIYTYKYCYGEKEKECEKEREREGDDKGRVGEAMNAK